MKILLVEDDPDARFIFRQMLSDYDVETIADGERAVELYKKIRPDLVLMDIALPMKDGVDAAKEILEVDENAKIIAITAYARQNRKRIMESGISDVLEKPFKMRELLDLVEKHGRK